MGNWIFLSSSFAVKNVGIFLRNVGKSDKNVVLSIKDVGKKRGGKRGEIPTLEIPKSLGEFNMYGSNYEVRTTRFESRGSEYEFRNTRFGARGSRQSKYEVRNTRFEIRRSEYDVRNTNLGIRSTKYEVRNRGDRKAVAGSLFI